MASIYVAWNNLVMDDTKLKVDREMSKPCGGRDASGMRRVRLLVWFLFRQTPLIVEVAEWVERGAARHCKLSWEEYCELKAACPELWRRGAEKRERAKLCGWPKQPPQLREH